MNQKQIFADPEKKKLPKDLDSSSLERTSEELAEDIQELLNELAILVADSQKLIKKLSKSQ